MQINTIAMRSIRFVSRNKFKLNEASIILATAGIEVIPLQVIIEELQTDDTRRLVRDKALRAFREVGRPLFVEHTGLYLTHLNGLPGGLTQVFWDKLQADRFASLFGNSPDPSAIAKTIVCYTDSKNLYEFEGEVSGRIAEVPRGPAGFQWDCVFIPKGAELTFAEMHEQKHDISMRRQALDRFASFLKGRQ